jgi:ATP-dependent Clp protease ATP-binding subunit ClpB
VLFDEIEKAHREVFNLLLQLLDDGRLTDGQGRTVDFRNTVVIMTSNLGSELWDDPAPSEQVTEDAIRSLLTRHFRPEFLNRIDEIVIFHRLNREQLTEIVGIQLGRVARRLREAGYELEITDGARGYLAEAGYDPRYGARPLKRAIQRELQDPLAMRILGGDFRPGDVIRVARSAEGLDFEVGEAALEPTI